MFCVVPGRFSTTNKMTNIIFDPSLFDIFASDVFQKSEILYSFLFSYFESTINLIN